MTAEEFNESYPVGVKVILTNDVGGEITTNTRSEAWDLCGTPVVKVDGLRAGYSLDRIKAVES